MANPNTSEKSNALDREENITKGNLSAKRTALFLYDGNMDTLSPVNADNPIPITGSITASSSAEADYGYYQEEVSGTNEYYGFTDPDANWLIKYINTSTNVMGWATVLNNGGTTDYATAWTNKTILTYGRKDQAF